MEVKEKDLTHFIGSNLTRADYFSCVILYEKSEDFAWYVALRIAEMVKSEFNKNTNIHLCFKIEKIVDKLNEMKENDVLILSVDNVNIKPLISHLVTELLNEKKNLIFVSKEKNSLNQAFKDITRVVINAISLSNRMLNCVIEISGNEKRDLKIKLPDKSIVDKYHELKTALLKETIRKQVESMRF